LISSSLLTRQAVCGNLSQRRYNDCDWFASIIAPTEFLNLSAKIVMLNLWRRLKKPQKTSSHLELGQLGERLALDFLLRQGYRPVVTNFTAPLGYSLNGKRITGEIDIVAYDESRQPFTLAFVEVKTRTSREFAAPQTAVDRRKQRQITKTARRYRRLVRVEDEPYRYDVVSVLILPAAQPQIELLRGYFTEETFAKSSWQKREF
jgi:putative endonuclease